MTDLIEQLKKGARQSGWYWVELKEGTFADEKKSIVLDYFSELTNSFEKHPYLVEQVLAPVPSYEEWEKLNWYAGNGVEENQELKMENAQLKTEYEKEYKRADELEDSYWKVEKENEKLKKQLEIVKKYLTLIKRNVSIGSLAYTYVSNAQTEIKELEK